MKILITKKIPEKGIQLLEEAGHKITVHLEMLPLTKAELIDLTKQHDAVVSAGGNQLDSNFFEQCKHLKCIALMSVGYDNVDITAANLYKIPVSNTSGVLSKATSDVAFLLMLAVSRNAFNMHKKLGKVIGKALNQQQI